MRVIRTFLLSVIVVATVCLILISPRSAVACPLQSDSDDAGAAAE